MSERNRRGLIGLIGLFATMVVLIFLPAGTFNYWQGWTFLTVYFVCSAAITIHLMVTDPALLERRMSGGPFAEKEPTQRLIMALMSIGFLALLVVPALDRRLGWSRMPDWVAILGDVVMTLGWLGIHFVFRVNTYTAATIQLAEDQHVISTGPYAVIRHPMYAGALLMLGGIPIALGSWWGFLVFLALLPGLAWRIVDEERFLIAHLKGYAEYRQTVRYRMIPGVW